MACPKCDSKNVITQKWDSAEIEEVPGILYTQVAILCKDCGWGFNCAGTLDKRPKNESRKVIPI